PTSATPTPTPTSNRMVFRTYSGRTVATRCAHVDVAGPNIWAITAATGTSTSAATMTATAASGGDIGRQRRLGAAGSTRCAAVVASAMPAIAYDDACRFH